ncbi:hypothetical protein KMZ29_25520 [Bradyrhizobium sediminis]|uniref:Uncharacterized protein n=1 Tax=Bradyrhizobium sediminis TaxID=2840469 RepID=A0A975NJ06_9BRAD|nr:hypothetical protein [Bradyrhizobium sediminis]QWG15967.1 hypothetical protein KMZ29_25520 [Bradyrhizobium sediminis]
MKQFCTNSAVAALVVLGGLASAAPAIAVPPTATPSPGYDARLQASRAARTVNAPVVVVPDPKPAPPRRAKRIHAH